MISAGNSEATQHTKYTKGKRTMANEYGIAVEGKIYRKHHDSVVVYTEAGGWAKLNDSVLSVDEVWGSLLEREDPQDVVVKHGCQLAIGRQTDIEDYIEPEVVEPEVMPRETELTTKAHGAGVQKPTTVGFWVTSAIKAHHSAQQLAKEAQIKAHQAVFYAAKCGAYLEQVKAKCSHGEWGAIVDDLPFGSTTSDKYRALAKQMVERLPNINLQELPAPEQLADPSYAEIVEQVNEVTEEKSLRQLYFDWGIVKAPKTKPRTIPDPSNLKNPPEIPDGETAAHLAAKGCWVEIAQQIDRCGLAKETANIHHLRLNELQDLKGVLIDLNAKVDGLIQAG